MQFELFASELPEQAECCGLPDAQWMVWCPNERIWIGVESDLAAKYCAQGCLVRLGGVEESGRVTTWMVPEHRDRAWPSPQPDSPPFSGSEIVWSYRAAEFEGGSRNDDWETIAAWLREIYRHPRPEDIAEMLSRRLGRWANLYDLEAAAFEGGAAGLI